MPTTNRQTPLFAALIVALLTFTMDALSQQAPGRAPPAPGAAAAPPPATPALRPCTSVAVDPPTYLVLGKSRVVRLDAPAARLVVGGQPSSRAGRPVSIDQAPGQPGPRAPGAAPAGGGGGASDGVADTEITLLSPTELFLLGRKTGSMNVVVQSTDGRCVVKDIIVTVDPETLQAKLSELMPEESGIKIKGAESSLVLTGSVSDLVKLDQVLNIAGSYADRRKVINLLRVSSPQQVMLEVQIAEVSKKLLDRLGLDFSRAFTTADGKSKIISGIIGGGAGFLARARGLASGPATSSTELGIDASKRDGIVRVLAEPNIMAISGQQASFLSGGKIFIPVAQTQGANGFPTITLEEKEFGVGLKFTPTVLDGRVNLKVVSEVSELSQTGTPFTAVGGVTAVLPSMATRRVDTTVQLGDGQSFAVAGLIKNNFTEALDKFPGLGEAPVVGALFRSSEFQNDQTELMFVVTPRLVKPFSGPIALPTDNHIVPSRADVLLNGMGEGSAPAARPAVVAPTQGAPAPAQQPTVLPAPPRPTSLAPGEPAPTSTTSTVPAPSPAETAVATPVQQAVVTPVEPEVSASSDQK
jgi:pilus assembly protein CpaC